MRTILMVENYLAGALELGESTDTDPRSQGYGGPIGSG